VVVLLCCYGNSNSIYTLITRYWVSVNEPHTSVFNVEFCLYHMFVPYVCTYMYRTVRGSQHSQLSWSLILCTTTATTCSFCFTERVCATVRPCLNMANRCHQMEWERTAAETQNERAAALHHLCVAYSFTLAPHTCPSLCCRSLRWRPGNWM